ncbi:MAG: endonuclease MutS2 [bacterium]
MDNRTLQILEYEKICLRLQEFAATTLGKEQVARMKPAQAPLVVNSRMAETTEARAIVSENDEPPFGGIRDVRESTIRASKEGILSPQELLEICDAVAGCRKLKRYHLRAGNDRFPGVMAQARLLQEFPAIEQAVTHAISSNAEVLDAASPELAKARRRVRSLNEGIQRELQRLLTSPQTQEMLQDPIITQRNGRFCLPVKAESRNAFKGIVHDLSASGQTAFMEPLVVMELGNDLREAERATEEETQRVLRALTAVVGKSAPALLACLDTIARLDLIYARALYSRAIDATPPVFNDTGVVDLHDARHPLLGTKAVPIDMRLGGEDTGETLLITGPNTGGKTVALKTVGLLVLMAQSGLHIPAAAESQLPIFAQVFADIGDEQSIEQSLSTFSGHLMNIINIMRDAGGKSLVLFDEIGAGTDPAEGAALAKAILLELQRRGCRTIATTHYGELKTFAQTTPGFSNAGVEFNLETLRPTYRVLFGLPGSSNALSIAGRLGLSKDIIVHARTLMGDAPQALDQVLKQAEGARRSLDRERSAAARSRHDAESIAAKMRKESEELNAKREELLLRARKQAQEVLEKARKESAALLEELRTAIREAKHEGPSTPTPNLAEMRKRARAALQEITGEVEELPAPAPAPSAPDKPSLTEVVSGQSVYVRSVGHRGIALGSGEGVDEVEVQVGILRVRVPVNELEAVSQQKVYIPPPPNATPPDVPPELQLLGLRAEEAAEKLEEYLFAAFDAGVMRVRIVHGFGTGVIRSVVMDILRNHPTVRTHRPGEPREGGGGVTMVELGRPE